MLALALVGGFGYGFSLGVLLLFFLRSLSRFS
jgi:hypothetical protein